MANLCMALDNLADSVHEGTVAPQECRMSNGSDRGALWFAEVPIARSLIEMSEILLERRVNPYLREISAGVEYSDILRQRRNFQEALPKIMKIRTSYLGNRTTGAYKALEGCGAMKILSNPWARRIASSILNQKIGPRCGVQVIRYGPGDYIGPHNDYQPEDVNLRHGYIDVHFSLSGHSAKSQQLVYENRGHLNRTIECADKAFVTVYRLPFWHHVTPMVARQNIKKGGSAVRWVFIQSFEIL
jgi:hypothetical protein